MALRETDPQRSYLAEKASIELVGALLQIQGHPEKQLEKLC